MSQVSFYQQSPDVALEFFRMTYPKESAGTKSTIQEMKLTQRTKAVSEQEPEQEPEQAGAPQALPIQGDGIAEQQAAARVIALRLRAIGDQLDQTLTQEIREKFEAEFKQKSVFSLTYDHFSRLCTQSLASVQSRVGSGWNQVYLLYCGYNEVAREIVRQAGDAAEDRLRRMANYLRDILRETTLEDWVESHGGLESYDPSSDISGERVVQIYVPDEGSSVDQ